MKEPVEFVISPNALVALYLVTVREPLVAVEGKATVMLVSLQNTAMPTSAPFKVIEPTYCVPPPTAIRWLGPNPLPLIVMVPPAGASGGVMLVMAGFGTSNELLEALGTEFTVTSN